MKKFLSMDNEINIVELRKLGRSPNEIMSLYDIKKHHYYNIIHRMVLQGEYQIRNTLRMMLVFQ
jgi:hypothetical protein